jgi:hypothetical protein
VQGSICSLFELVSFTIAAVAHQPERFHFLMLGSLGSVATGWALYVTYVLKPQRRYQLIEESTGDI